MSPRKAPTTTAAAPSNPSMAPVQAPGSSADGATTANGHANAHAHADGTSSTDDSSRRHRRGNRLTTEVDTNLIIDSGEGGRRARRRHDGGEEGHGKEEAVVESEEDRRMRIMEARAVAREVGEAIHDAVMKETNKEGYIISAPFVKLPNKRQFPDYYNVIKHPLALDQIKSRLSATPSSGGAAKATIVKEERYDGYDDVAQVKHDFDIVFNNAKRYNTPESQIYADARALHKLVKTIYNERTATTGGDGKEASPTPDVGGATLPGVSAATVSTPAATSTTAVHPPAAPTPPADVSYEENGEEDEDDENDPSRPNKRRRLSSSAPGSEPHTTTPKTGSRGPRGPYQKHGPSVYKMCKSGMLALDKMKSKDGTDRRIADVFDELPDKKDYADYYTVIRHPISIAEISSKIQKRMYSSLEAWQADVELMCDNAMAYNVEGSTVYNDAAFLKREIRENVVPGIRQRHHADQPRDTGSPRANSFGPVHAQNVGPGGIPPYNPAAVAALGLPPLPANMVTPDIVAQLPNYPEHIRVSWASSLSGPNAALLSSLLRDRDQHRPLPAVPATPTPVPYMPPPPPVQMPAVPSPYLDHRLPQSPAIPPAPLQPPLQPRPPLGVPLIRYLTFSYDVPNPAEMRSRRKTIKLRNIRGVVSHTVAVGAKTAAVEIAAHLEEGFYDMLAPIQGSDRPDTIASSLATAPLPEMTLRVDGRAIPGMLLYPQNDYNSRPSGCRWEVPLPLEANSTPVAITTHRRAEMVPGGRPDMTETTMIYVGRQLP